MPFNYAKLEGKIRELCGTQAIFATKIGLSERSVSLKLNNQREWKQSEIVNACNVLDISQIDVPLYFFTFEVQNDEPLKVLEQTATATA